MHKKITLLLSATLVVSVLNSSLHAQPVNKATVDALIQQANNPENVKPTGGSIGGQAEQSMGVGSSGAIPKETKSLPKALITPLVAQGCFTNWWISGTHTWKSKSYFFYAKTSLSARTWTRYGTSTAPCDVPLNVDKIEVIGTTSSNDIVSPKATVNKVLYNVSTVSSVGTDRVRGINVKIACGARVFHRATKGSVVWNVVSESGCKGRF